MHINKTCTPTQPPKSIPHFGYNTSTTTSPSSSPGPEGPIYYIQQQTPTSMKMNKHSRSVSHTPNGVSGGTYVVAGYPPPTHYRQVSDLRPPPGIESVSPERRPPPLFYIFHSAPRGGYDVSYSRGGNTVPQHHPAVQSQKQRVNVDSSDEAEDSPHYIFIKPRTGVKQEKSTQSSRLINVSSTIRYLQKQTIHRSKVVLVVSQESRPRTSSGHTSQESCTAKRTATAADAAKHNIPEGFSLKNWDPTEAPIKLLGSVFDANSLGKWIYDWTALSPWSSATYDRSRRRPLGLDDSACGQDEASRRVCAPTDPLR
ncbi:hypothetical protein ABVK25_012439 [Lepraria finkii]|uniref:Uncharacterized protein n=1 Tax=Lepraria finkii TaxID=1340010 RepID=A0ABR4AH18_9LECA